MSDKKITKTAAEAPKTPVEAPVKEPVEAEKINAPENEPKTPVSPMPVQVTAPTEVPKPSIGDEERRRLEAEILGSTGVVSGDDGVILEHGAERKSVKEMIMDYFRPTDLVKIHNPFKWHTGWAYSHPDEEVVEQDGSATRRVWPGKPKTRILPAGHSVVIPGWEAYIGVTRFYKQWCQVEHPSKFGVAINSPVEFAKFMKLVYDGVYDPNANQNNPAEMDARAALERDLGLV